MGMCLQGRRSKLGSMHGPLNQESLNATHPAMLAGHRFNSDVQLPYRFPIIEGTHACEELCVDSANEMSIVEAAQAAQDAQAGYACDYCNKRHPMAFNEVKECCKGHTDLNQSLHGERVNYIGKRHATRLMCEAYGKGIVRGQVENTNLRANFKDNDVTHCKTFRTCQTESFFGREYLSLVERLTDKKKTERSAIFGEVDGRNPQKKKVTFRDVAVLYGHRPTHDALRYLSAY